MAVIIYDASDKNQISEHFNVQEFKCKCGKNHEIKIDSKLVKFLEMLITELKAKKCIVSSGYRCPEHDKAVGGGGFGQHTKGTAADVCFYDENDVPISSKIVSCKAQDIGVPGIANINKNYSYIHLDTRASGKYYGNEIYGYNTVTNDFYKYYGIKKATLNKGSNSNVKEWQESALKDGFKLASGADGIWGNECLTVAKTAICKRIKGKYENKNLVKIIQKKIGVEVDGKFGKKTEAAVKEFQRKHGLTADGIVGVNTWKAILNIK